METDGKDRRARWFLNHYQVDPLEAPINYHTDTQLSAAPPGPQPLHEAVNSESLRDLKNKT